MTTRLSGMTGAAYPMKSNPQLAALDAQISELLNNPDERTTRENQLLKELQDQRANLSLGFNPSDPNNQTALYQARLQNGPAGQVDFNTWMTNPYLYGGFGKDDFSSTEFQRNLDQFKGYVDSVGQPGSRVTMQPGGVSFEQWKATNPTIKSNPYYDWGLDNALLDGQRFDADRGDIWETLLPGAAMTLATLGAGGAFGNLGTGEFAGMGTFGGGAGGALTSTAPQGVLSGGGSMATADAAGLTQMAADAGLTGSAAEAFVASGGALGSTAAGGGGLELLQWAQQYPGAVDPTSGALNWDAITQGMTNLQGVTAATGSQVPGFWENLLNGVTPSPANVANGLKSLLPGSGNGSGETFGISNDILKGVLGAGIGAYGSDKMADAISGIGNQQNALAQQYLDMGAPYRGLLQDTYKPGFDLMSQPGYGDAFNRMAEISTNAWSPKGNPANSPGIQAGILNDVWSQNYLPALTSHRGQLGQFGGMGVNTSASMFGNAANAGMNAANADMGGIRALGYGLSSFFPTSNPQDDFLKQLTERTRQQNEQYRVTAGGKSWQ